MMALVKCNECGAEISDQANTCLQCGASKKVAWIKNWELILVVVVAVFVASLLNEELVSAGGLITYLIVLGIGLLLFRLKNKRSDQE
jgi:hypothetical protein